MKLNMINGFIISFITVLILPLSVVMCADRVYAQEESAEPAPAQAPAAGATQAPKGKKTTTIDFEDQLVEGTLRKPELFYLLQKKQINFGRLIKMRENFLPEMQRTSEEVQRGVGEP